MKPLTERVLALIPETPHGLSLRAAVKTLRQDTSYVRAAFERLEKSGKARIARRGRGGALYLLLPSPATLICVIPGCHREFIRGHKSKRVTCSRACHAAYGWRNPEKSAKRRASISAAHKSPKARARLAAFNQKRWSDPKEKEKLALQNSRRWKDRPEEFERYRALMRIIQSTPERKAFYSELRKAFWRDPVMRKKMHDAATKSLRVAAYRKLFSEYMKRRWQDPVMREKYTKANHARNNPAAKAKNSKRLKKLWADPNWRETQVVKIRRSRASAEVSPE